MDNVVFFHKSDHWATPSDLYWYFTKRLGLFDPCPLHADFDGLSLDWPADVFINPPYSNILPFVVKAIEHQKHLGGCIYMLLPVRTDTRWFLLLEDFGCRIEFFPKRLHFNDSKNGAPFLSMLVTLLGDGDNEFTVFNLDFIHELFLKRKEYIK